MKSIAKAVAFFDSPLNLTLLKNYEETTPDENLTLQCQGCMVDAFTLPNIVAKSCHEKIINTGRFLSVSG